MISRKLHDQVAQSIAAGLNLLSLSDHYAERGDAERARAKRADAETAMRQALNVTKELATSLRVRQRIAARSRATPPPPTASAELLVIVREAVHNAMAHARASTITIRLSADQDVVTASVVDDGVGLRAGQATSQTSLGLQSIRERTTLLGGLCRIGSGGGVGTEVVVEVPCRRQP
jgi:signal transduction histidine kinase